MPTFGTATNPAHFVEIADALNPGQVKRPAAGLIIKARAHADASALSDITTTDYGYWAATFDVDAIEVSGDDGATWIGPLFSVESMEAASTAGLDAASALTQSTIALSTAQDALTQVQGGVTSDWSTITNKPTTFPPSAHSHPVSQISGTSLTVQTLLGAADQQAARAAIGAGTGNGTSNLTLGGTATTAAPGNHVHAAVDVTFAPTGSITATTVQGAIAQAATTGGSGTGTPSLVEVFYSSGAYPAQAASPPAGCKHRAFYGPVQYAGPTWPGVVDTYQYVALT